MVGCFGIWKMRRLTEISAKSLLRNLFWNGLRFISGMIAFIGITAYFMSRPSLEIQWQEKAVFSAFFIGAILCLGFSWVFHTVFNHSQRIGKLFNKWVQLIILNWCYLLIIVDLNKNSINQFWSFLVKLWKQSVQYKILTWL